MGTAIASLRETSLQVSLADALRLLAHTWMACVLLLLACGVAVVLSRQSGLLAAFVCFLLLVATITACLICVRRQAVVIPHLRNRNVAIKYWWIALSLAMVGLAPGIAMEVAVFLAWCDYVVPTEARESEVIQTGEVTRDEAIQNLTVTAGAIGLNSGIGGTSVWKPTA